MSYDPTQQVPPPVPQGYPPQQNYPQQPPGSYPAYPPAPPPGPPTYQQYATPPAPGTSAGFDLAVFWKKLGTTGQVCLIGGVVLFLSLLLDWYSESIGCSGPQCTDDAKNFLKAYERTANGWGMANGGITLNIGSASGAQSFNFPLLWLVILASLVLIVLPILAALGKLAAQQTQLFVLIASGLALLVEVIYMFAAFSSLSPLKDDITRGNGSSSTTASMATGPAFGFVLGLLATLAAGGIYIYLGYIKKPAADPYALPYQQVAQQYPGSQPYQPPTQYQQPYQPPTQYQQPPQYPGQYPGQQPPQYPGQ